MFEIPIIPHYPPLSKKRDNEKNANAGSFSKMRGVIDYIIYYYHIIIPLSQKDKAHSLTFHNFPQPPRSCSVRDNADNGIMTPLFTSGKVIIHLIIHPLCNGQSLKKIGVA